MSEARAERWAIEVYAEMNTNGWTIDFDAEEWVLYVPSELAARFQLIAPYAVGRYGNLAQAYGAYRAVRDLDSLSDRARVSRPQ
jgi:hypothetical protein